MSGIINIILGAVILFLVVVAFYGYQLNIKKADLVIHVVGTVHHAVHTVKMRRKQLDPQTRMAKTAEDFRR